MNTRTASFFAVMLVGMATTPAWAEDESAKQPLPTGAEILDRHVQACGGVGAFDKLRNRVIQARFLAHGPDGPLGRPGTMTMYEGRPNLTYTIAHLDRVTRSENGCDGQVVWDSNTRTGSRIKEGEGLQQGLIDAIFYKDIYWRTAYKEAQCTGLETIDGTLLYKVELIPHSGRPETRYYDKKTGLLNRSVAHFSDGTDVPTTYHKYREIDGVLVAHGRTQTIVNPIEVTFTKVEHNVDLPVEIFQPPEVIMNMLASGQTAAPPARGSKQVDMGPGKGIGVGPPQLRQPPAPKPVGPPAPQPSGGG